MKLLTVSNDPKTVKGEKRGFLTGIMYLAPSTASGFNVCQFATKACADVCLYHSGRAKWDPRIPSARIDRTRLFFRDRAGFLSQLRREIDSLIRKGERENLSPVVRLNGMSDLPWERIFPRLFSEYAGIRFYDYTKIPGRLDLPPNYSLTFSRSETNAVLAKRELAAGRNVAVVFRDKLPAEYWGHPVVNGDETDLRFLDPSPVVVGLRAKGTAKKDRSGFVVDSRGAE